MSEQPIRITRTTSRKDRPKDKDLAFGNVFSDHMFVMDFEEEKGWYDPRVERRLAQVADACRAGDNVMPVLIDAVKDYASLGEISDVYRQVFGLYREPIIF